MSILTRNRAPRMADCMSDLDFILIGLMIGPLIYAGVSLRNSGRRLHYRDRPLFWQRLIPLLLPTALALWMPVQMVQTGVALHWQLMAVIMACAVAGLAWWIDLNPNRVLARLSPRR